MSLSEFDLIRRFFVGLTPAGADVVAGIGDDGAVVRPPAGSDLVVTSDTLTAGTHFLVDVDPADLGYKSLAVNLSDLAAMGATPAWFTLALTLPEADADWLEGLAAGLSELAREQRVALIGGDTTRGPLSLTITAHGLVPTGAALTRGGAADGDLVFVTGTLGDAALALAARSRRRAVAPSLAARLDRPQPRVAAGLALRGLATAAIDISDGLVADAGHLGTASDLALELEAGRLPLSDGVASHVAESGDWAPVLSGGDDYELLFTVPVGRQHEVEPLAEQLGLRISRIGHTGRGRGVAVQMPDGSYFGGRHDGYQHFGGA